MNKNRHIIGEQFSHFKKTVKLLFVKNLRPLLKMRHVLEQIHPFVTISFLFILSLVKSRKFKKNELQLIMKQLAASIRFPEK